MSSLTTQADRVDAALAAFRSMRPTIERTGPWALAELYGTEAEASWGPPELLAHVTEMLPFWLGEVERILESARPGPFGRVADDDVRIGIIGRDRTVPFRELYARLTSDGARIAARMRELTSADAARTGLHPTRGEMAVEELLERFVTGHLEGHVAQLRDILAQRGG